MKRLVVGDIHGHWEKFKEIYDYEDPDEVIMLGDYFDNFHGSDESIINCFENILALRKTHIKERSGDFIMLMGNHDYHYIFIEQYSGYRRSYDSYANKTLDYCLKNDIIKWAHIDNINKVIYSHAGVTNMWLNKYNLTVNDINDAPLNSWRFTYANGGDCYGSSNLSSPIWVRPKTLINDMYVDSENITWTQLIGHTHFETPYIIENKLYVIDCLPNFYISEDYDENTKKINYREIIDYGNADI